MLFGKFAVDCFLWANMKDELQNIKDPGCQKQALSCWVIRQGQSFLGKIKFDYVFTVIMN